MGVNIEQGDGRRQHLLDCSQQAFAQRGFHATTISHIVQQAGIARGTFYHYFDNKLEVFETILDSFVQRLRDCINPIALGPGALPPLTQVQDNLTRVLNLVLTEQALTQILLQHATSPHGAVEERVKEFYRQVAEMIERSLAFGMSMNLVRPCDTRLTAYSMIGAVKEVVLQLTSSRKPQPPVEELVRNLIQFGIGGILIDSSSYLPPAHNLDRRPDFSQSRR